VQTSRKTLTENNVDRTYKLHISQSVQEYRRADTEGDAGDLFVCLDVIHPWADLLEEDADNNLSEEQTFTAHGHATML
jgi:hypothetical protein